VKIEAAPRSTAVRHDEDNRTVNQFLEAAFIALGAIWANKLRSFLTVLGNIVAVTSIIAVVSLVQGMNEYVTNTIVADVGADNFTIQRDAGRPQSGRRRSGAQQPADHADGSRGDPPLQQQHRALSAEASASATMSYRTESVDGAQVQGVSADYINFSTYDVERGRLISPVEIATNRPVTIIGWDVADKLFGPVDPLDKTISIARVHFRVVGVHKKKGSAFGNSQDNFAIISLGTFQKMFGSRMFGMQLVVKPKTPELVKARWTTRRWRCASSAGCGRRTRQLRDVHVRHAAQYLPHGDQRHLRGADRRRGAVAGRRRHRDHEHHADGRQRAHARDRLRKALGRPPPRHRLADPHRVGDALDVRGVIGTFFGFLLALAISKFTPLPAAVQIWSVAIGIGITALVGLFFGLYPAMRAAKLDPIEALRSSAQWHGANNGRPAQRTAVRNRRDVVRHAAHEQDALGADRARRGHRHHLDRRHDVAHPRLRSIAARCDHPARPDTLIVQKWGALSFASARASSTSRGGPT
jgi:putative ABC transport system permease protein